MAADRLGPPMRPIATGMDHPAPAVPEAARPRTAASGGRSPAPAARSKPDARPMRLAIGATGLAALSAVVTAIAIPSGGHAATIATAAIAAQSVPAVAASQPTTLTVRRPIRYVQLKPGESAPPGAKVIEAAAPKPVTVVTRVAAPAQRPIVVRTTQSGRILP